MPSYTTIHSPLQVLYEDNHVIAVYKPCGILTQGDSTGDPTLMDWVKDYLRARYAKPGNVFLGLVHRLDRLVSGVVVFARTSKGASRLSEQIRSHAVVKVYHAVVEGTPRVREGQLVHYLGSDSSERVAVRANPEEGLKRAVLRYRVLETGNGRSLLEILLETGRKHQIRAQLSAIGHAIVGDAKYGSPSSCFGGKGIGLVARRFEFSHPTRPQEHIVVEVPDSLYPLKELLA